MSYSDVSLEFIHININTDSFHILAQLHFPSSSIIHIDVNNSIDISRLFNMTFHKSTYSIPSERTNKQTMLKYNILPCSVLIILLRILFCSTNVTFRIYDYSICYCRI